jgi:transglutaminase-like putative cysteine protease
MYDFQFNIIQQSDVLFSLGRPISLRVDERVNVEFNRLTRTMRIVGNQNSPNAYTVRVQVRASDRGSGASRFVAPPIVADDSGRGPLYRGNGVTSRIEDLTKRVLRDAGLTSPQPYDDAERAQWNRDAAKAIVAYLRSPKFTYTLDLSDVVRRMNEDGRPQDPTEQFLFETQRGHCEYFASAMALMCRSVGVPARLISGYVAYNYDRKQRAYQIVQANAHSWVEVQTIPGRWETFDPTPQSEFDRQHDAPINAGNRLRAFYDDIERGWTNNFVKFNRDTQTQMVQSLEGTWWQRLGDIGESLREWARRVNRAFYFGPAGYIWMGLVGLVIIVAIIAAVKYARRAWRLREVLALEDVNRPGRRRMRRQLAFYLDMLTVLERGGLAKPDWQPPRLFAHSLLASTSQSTGQPEPSDPVLHYADQPQRSIGEIVRELTDLFYAGRYGNRRLDDEQTRRAHSMLRELADRLKVRL